MDVRGNLNELLDELPDHAEWLRRLRERVQLATDTCSPQMALRRIEERKQHTHREAERREASVAAAVAPYAQASRAAAERYKQLCHELDTFDFGKRRAGVSYYDILLMEGTQAGQRREPQLGLYEKAEPPA